MPQGMDQTVMFIVQEHEQWNNTNNPYRDRDISCPIQEYGDKHNNDSNADVENMEYTGSGILMTMNHLVGMEDDTNDSHKKH